MLTCQIMLDAIGANCIRKIMLVARTVLAMIRFFSGCIKTFNCLHYAPLLSTKRAKVFVDTLPR